MAAMPPDEQLQLLAASLARARGDDFFPVLAAHLGVTLGARESSICEALPGRRVRTLGAWRGGATVANYDYDLAGTPCARVYGGERVLTDIDPSIFPGAPRGSVAYFGTPLAAKDGAVLGHLCAWSDQPFTMSPEQRAICELVADRAAAEMRLVHVKRERSMLRAQRRQLRAELAAIHDLQSLVGVSAAHHQLVEEIRRVAAASAPVLLSGEPGTGKELIARAIHAAGPRASKPFTRIDCTQLLIDAEIAALPQVFAFSTGGTIYFDEVGGLTPAMQERLQLALQGLEAGRSGAGPRDAGVADVRVIAASGRDLRSEAREGAFRTDLLHELGAFLIDVPPLRARVEDIPPLVQHFVHKLSRRHGRRIDGVDPDSLAALMRYSWPGNMRELASLVERSMAVQRGPLLKVLPDFNAGTPAERAALIAAASVDTSAITGTYAIPSDFDDTLNTGLHAVQREHILRVLNATHWVIEGNSGAALRLGLKPATLRHRMKKLGISRAQSPQHS
jgi:transcriptional regulator with GAF, ATPase, and Fis domain